MPKDGPGGLIGKVVRLVLPGSSRSTLLAGSRDARDGGADSEPDAGKGRQLLRELMERRRRNDMVRQREFDQLRRVRRLVAASTVPAQDGGGDSAFADTAADKIFEERASTLRKINEIEEQMSRQWWKTRPAEPADLAHSGSERNPRRPREAPSTRHQPLPSGAAIDLGLQGPARPASAFQTTSLQGHSSHFPSTGQAVSGGISELPAFGIASQPRPAPRPAAIQPDLELPDMALPDLELPDAVLSQLVATGPGPLPGPQPALPGFVHQPGLEEAAIEFANAEVAAAETSLRQLIDQATAAGEAEDVLREYWFALFDLYRALGRRDAFEVAVISYAERFGRSPPAWMSLAASAAPDPEGIGDFFWRSPLLVGAHTVARLRAGAATSGGAWWLDWSGLEGFEYDAVAPMLDTFSAWSALPAQIYFEGGDRLLAALEARTLTGAADAEADWWRLRMETLRLLRRIDDYEEAALDYCITYEVSPPSWQPPACDCLVVQAGSCQAAQARPQPAGDEAAEAGLPEAAALAGEIGSDVPAVLARLDAVLARQAGGAPPGREEWLVIDCSRLIRLDFVAAGSVLGWAASRHGEGLAVEFRNLHRLVATFFNVTGISEYARVYTRPD